MSDLISREAAIGEIKSVFCTDCDNYKGVRCRACNFDDAMGVIEDMPSANQWISGDNLPKESGQYIVTNKDGRVFVDTWCGTGWWECFPVAWRPLPEPYVEVEE